MGYVNFGTSLEYSGQLRLLLSHFVRFPASPEPKKPRLLSYSKSSFFDLLGIAGSFISFARPKEMNQTCLPAGREKDGFGFSATH